MSQLLFNLILNSTCSFLAGLLIVGLAVMLFRINDSRWKLFLWSLPFVKILWDLIVRGIPASSVIYTGINPLNLPPKHQWLTIGAGFSEYGPELNVVFSANALNGKNYSTSVADYLFAWLSKHWGQSLPSVILVIVLGVSILFVVRRLWGAVQFELKRRETRRHAIPIETVPLRFRSVDIYGSGEDEGTPFTGGIFRPYICIPEKVSTVLDIAERQAVKEHEIAHIKHWDLLFTLLIKLLGDFFWFVPGYRWLSRQIDRLREILADEAAVRAGASPVHLASALVKLRDIPEDNHHAVLYSAFFREKSLLKRRVENLIGSGRAVSQPRLGWKYLLVKVVVVTWTAGAVMIATLGGNHEATATDVSPRVERVLKHLGLM